MFDGRHPSLSVDTQDRHVDHGSMTARAKRTKRTYNLAEPTIRRVRELSEVYGAASTQDAVVDLAVERLYVALREQQEADLWARSVDDPAFRREMRAVDRDLRGSESWPE